MEDLLTLLIVVLFFAAPAIKSIMEKKSQKDKAADENETQQPHNRPAPVQDPREQPIHETEPVFKEPQDEPFLAKMLKELLDVQEPEIVTPVAPPPPQPEPIRKVFEKKHKRSPASQALRSLQSAETSQRVLLQPQRVPLQNIVAQGKTHPLKTAVMLSEILQKPRALHPYSPKSR